MAITKRHVSASPSGEAEQARAKVFMNGRSQAVRLPQAFRFATDEVYVRRDALTGDVVLSERAGPKRSLEEIFADLDACPETQEFADSLIRDRDRSMPTERDWDWK